MTRQVTPGQLSAFNSRLIYNLRLAGSKFPRHFARHFVLNARINLLRGDGRPVTSSRVSAVSKIRARIGNKPSIKIPDSLINLDTMQPHYVSLKKGRGITKWANKHFTGARVSGKSRVYRTVAGRIAYKQGMRSFLFVTPLKWLNNSATETFRDIEHITRQDIIDAIEKTVNTTIGKKVISKI